MFLQREWRHDLNSYESWILIRSASYIIRYGRMYQDSSTSRLPERRTARNWIPGYNWCLVIFYIYPKSAWTSSTEMEKVVEELMITSVQRADASMYCAKRFSTSWLLGKLSSKPWDCKEVSFFEVYKSAWWSGWIAVSAFIGAWSCAIRLITECNLD